MLPLFVQLLVFTASSSQTEEVIKPHKSQIVGGLIRQTAEASENLERAWEAVKALNQGSADAERLMIPIKVQKAESQVVAGIRYIYEVLYGESTCNKDEAASNDFAEIRAKCHLKEGGKKALYKVDLWEKPWQNFEQFTITKMQDVRA